MGRLFENVTMDIQAERRNTAEARAERDLARQERDRVWQDLEIHKHVLRMIARRCPDDEIVASLTRHFHLTAEQAAEILKQAFEE